MPATARPSSASAPSPARACVESWRAGCTTSAGPSCWAPTPPTRPRRPRLAARAPGQDGHRRRRRGRSSRRDRRQRPAAPGRPRGRRASARTRRRRHHHAHRRQPRNGRDVAAQAGVDEVRAGLLPEDKVAAVEDSATATARSRWSAMASTTPRPWPGATLGIAMGAAGTDTALETADIALMGDDLARRALRHPSRPPHQARRLAEHRLLARGEVDLPGPRAPRHRQPVAGRVRRHGASLLVTANGLRLYRR